MRLLVFRSKRARPAPSSYPASITIRAMRKCGFQKSKTANKVGALAWQDRQRSWRCCSQLVIFPGKFEGCNSRVAQKWGKTANHNKLAPLPLTPMAQTKLSTNEQVD
jgi:hypothetical protein